MKRIVAAFAFCFVLIISKANPIFLPYIYLKEFVFVENQQWRMNISYLSKVDSIFISSSTGSSKCKLNAEQSSSIVHVGRDSLFSETTINPLGDSVTICIYFRYSNNEADSILETLVFGNYPNAAFPAPSKGGIIIRYIPDINERSCYYVQDSKGKSSGLLHGKIYDNKNQLLTSGLFNISPFPILSQCTYENTNDVIQINEDGTYSTSLLSINYNLNSINNCIEHYWGDCLDYRITNSLEIEPINISMTPDTIIEMDIHLIDEYVGINTFKANTAELIRIFPNPITNNQLQYEITTPVRSTNSCIIIYSLQGQKLCQFPINENKGSIELPSNISNGNYLLQLWMNNKAYGSEQFNVNR